MKTFWENNGEANDQGDFIATVDKEDGSRPSRFIAKTQKDVADKVMGSYANLVTELDRRKAEDAKHLRPDQPPAHIAAPPPSPMTPDEAFIATDAINDPSRVQQTVKQIVEAASGIRMSELGKIVTENRVKEADDYFGQEAIAFTRSIPDYTERYFNDENSSSLLNYCEANKMLPTRNNLTIAFNDLQRKGLLTENLAEEEQTHEPGTVEQPNPVSPPNQAPQRRPRIASTATAIRNGDASATPPTPSQRPKITRAQLDVMSKEEYARNMRIPDFVKAVNALN